MKGIKTTFLKQAIPNTINLLPTLSHPHVLEQLLIVYIKLKLKMNMTHFAREHLISYGENVRNTNIYRFLFYEING